MALGDFWYVATAFLLGVFAMFSMKNTEPNSKARFLGLAAWIFGLLLLGSAVMPTPEETRAHSTDGIIHNSVFLPLFYLWLSTCAGGVTLIFMTRLKS